LLACLSILAQVVADTPDEVGQRHDDQAEHGDRRHRHADAIADGIGP
jgi:hypothetical protein